MKRAPSRVRARLDEAILTVLDRGAIVALVATEIARDKLVRLRAWAIFRRRWRP